MTPVEVSGLEGRNDLACPSGGAICGGAPSQALATELGHPDQPPASPPVADNAPGLLALATEAAQIEVIETLTFWPFPFLQWVPLTQGISCLCAEH